MILNTLTLHNFMSYGDSKLDLTSISIACLTGLNGAGKSAILDAVTWCLWESARASSDELIRAGQLDMYVDLDFDLEDRTYRVRRSRQRSFPRAGGRPLSKGGLDFQIWQADRNTESGAGKWKSLTCSSMRDTQLSICNVLQMDYDTFINSVYLRQGRADEFTMRAPGERKQVLAEILGLAYFDRLQAAAHEHSKQIKFKIESLQSAIAASNQLPASLQLMQSRRITLQEELVQNISRLEQVITEQAQLQALITDLANIESHLEPTQSRLAELQQDIDTLIAVESALTSNKMQLLSILNQAGDLNQAASEFKTVKSRVEQLDKISFERQDFEKRRMELKSTIAALRGRMEVEVEHLTTQLSELKIRQEKIATDLQQRDRIEQDHQKYRRLLADEAQMSSKQENFVLLTTRCEQLHTIIVETRLHLEAELEQKSQSVAELCTLIQNKDVISTEHADLLTQVEELDKLEIEFIHVEESGLKLKQQIDGVNAQVEQLKRQLSENHTKLHELQSAQSLTMCPLCAAPIVDRDAVAQRYKKINDQLTAEVEHLCNTTAELEDKRTALRQRYLELRRKLDQRKGLDTKIGEYNARLAALERADSNYNRLLSEVSTVKTRLEQQLYAVVERESLINLKAEIHKLEFDPVVYTSLQSQLRAQRHAEVRHQQLAKDQAQALKLSIDVPQLEQRVEQIQLQLANEDFAQEARAGILELDKQLGRYDYDRSEHQILHQRMSALLPLIERFRDLERATQELPALESQLDTTLEQIAAKQLQHQTVLASARSAIERLHGKDDAVLQLSETAAQIQTLASEKEELLKELTILETKLEQHAVEQDKLESARSEINELIVQMNDYEMLAESFGKKGIQAIIIENAVPEIESEANHILSRLSDNMMHVALITQYKTRQGNLQETLDIVIADGLGTRNYELYSGGEAFKINFAIRIALSRLLARRAGAKLQTLFIDEGFGSQDETSRNRLMQSINAIKPAFARILVVTHINEIKELFPVQIQVQKENGVSSLNILHTG